MSAVSSCTRLHDGPIAAARLVRCGPDSLADPAVGGQRLHRSRLLRAEFERRFNHSAIGRVGFVEPERWNSILLTLGHRYLLELQ